MTYSKIFCLVSILISVMLEFSDPISTLKVHNSSFLKSHNLILDTIPQSKRNENVTIKLDSLETCIERNNKLEKELKEVKYQLKASIEKYENYIDVLKKNYSIKGNKAYSISYKNKMYDCYEVDLTNSEISFFLKDSKGNPISSLEKLNRILSQENKQLVFAANGGMYAKDQNPQGLFIQRRKLISNIDKRVGLYGNFYMQPNGIFYIDTCMVPGIITTNSFNEEIEKYIEFATQSGPMLIIDSKMNSNFKDGSENVNIRNGVGINDKGKLVFVISNEKVNFFDFGSFFLHKLKCDNALYLDGAISETYLPEIGRFQNGGMFGPIIGIYKK